MTLIRPQTKRLVYISRSDLAETPYADVILPALARDAWHITVIAPSAQRSILREVISYRCKPYDLVPRRSSFLREVEIFKALVAARVGTYDVICINSQSLSARAALAFAGPKFGKRIVYHNPDYYDPFRHPFHSKLEGMFCRKADLYINNEFHRGYITQAQYRVTCPIITAPPSLPSAWAIPPRSKAKRLEMMQGKDRDAFLLILHGGYSELRMVPQLFEALAYLPEKFKLVMTNRLHRKEEVDAQLKKLKIGDRVCRLPRQTFPQLLEHTVNADAGVLLYQNNDLGNFFSAPGRMSEYLACGLPVLTSNHTGLENLVLRYGLGESVDSTDPRQIAEKLRLLEAAVKQGHFRRSSMRERFLKHFAFDHWESQIISAFNDLLSREGRCHKESRPRFPWLPNP